MACDALSVRVSTPEGTSAVVEGTSSSSCFQAVVDFNSDYGAPYSRIWYGIRSLGSLSWGAIIMHIASQLPFSRFYVSIRPACTNFQL